MRNPPAIEQTKHPRSRMRSGACRIVAQAGSKPWLPQVSSPQTHSAPPRLSLLMTSHEAMPIYFVSLIVFWPHAERWISLASPGLRTGGCFWGAIQPIFLARVRVRRFAEKAFTLHHGSQTPDTKSLMGEGFTLFSLHLYLHTLPLRAIALRPSPLYV